LNTNIEEQPNFWTVQMIEIRGFVNWSAPWFGAASVFKNQTCSWIWT